MKWYSACLRTSVAAFLPHALSKMQQNSGKAYIMYTRRKTFHYLREWHKKITDKRERCHVSFFRRNTVSLMDWWPFRLSDMGSTPTHETHQARLQWQPQSLKRNLSHCCIMKISVNCLYAFGITLSRRYQPKYQEHIPTLNSMQWDHPNLKKKKTFFEVIFHNSYSSPNYDDKINRMKWVGNVAGMMGK